MTSETFNEIEKGVLASQNNLRVKNKEANLHEINYNCWQKTQRKETTKTTPPPPPLQMLLFIVNPKAL